MNEQVILAKDLRIEFDINHVSLINRANKIGITPRKQGTRIVFTATEANRLRDLHQFMQSNRNIAAFLLEEKNRDTVENATVEIVEIQENQPLVSHKVQSLSSEHNPILDVEFLTPPAKAETPERTLKEIEIWFGTSENYAQDIFEKFWAKGHYMSTEQIESLIGETKLPEGDTYQYGSFIFIRRQIIGKTGMWQVNKLAPQTFEQETQGVLESRETGKAKKILQLIHDRKAEFEVEAK